MGLLKSRIKLLSLSVASTVVLLAIGAGLVVLGIFNEYLSWDIFSPPVKKVLWGIFSASVALGAFGAAISAVLGIQEVAKALRRMGAANSGPEPEAPRRHYLAWMAVLLAITALTVISVDQVNRYVQRQRIVVFKRLVHAQMNQFAPLLAREVEKIAAPCTTCVSARLTELMQTLHELPFCQSVVLVMADPQESAALWRDDANVSPDAGPRFERFFIATDVDRAMKLALNGDTAWVDQMNAGPAFNWIQILRDPQGKPRATLRILGNPTESYRDEDAVDRGAS
ncbi:MAG TPA: hypothetical protein VGS07_24265 [Thermoanaerobaculia bacterium]|jgi:hypothetical protein|nr:hypothetical protein [Thermoanaerobaculia bacterium]